MKYPLEVYQKYQEDCPIWGEPDEDTSSYAFKFVKARKDYKCCNSGPDITLFGDPQKEFSGNPCAIDINPGDLHLFEKALRKEEGWQSARTCMNCLDEWLDGLFDQCGAITYENN